MLDEKKFCLYSGNKGSKNLAVRWFIFWYTYNPVTLVKKRHKKYIYDFPTIEQRQQAAEQLMAELSDEPDRLKHKYSNLVALLREGLKLHSPNLEPKTHTTYKNFLQNYDECIHEIGEYGIRKFIKHLHDKEYSATTINHHVALLRMLFEQLKDEGHIDKNPCDGVNALKERRKKGKFFTDQQRAQLKATISMRYPELNVPVRLLYYCFIRPKEMRLLKVRDINLREKTITVPASVAKNGTEQIILIPDVFVKFLREQHIDHNPPDYFLVSAAGGPSPLQVGKKNFYKKFKEVLKQLNFGEGYYWYSWKYTGNFEAISNNIPLKELQLQNRHAHLKTMQGYSDSMKPQQSKFIQELFPEF